MYSQITKHNSSPKVLNFSLTNTSQRKINERSVESPTHRTKLKNESSRSMAQSQESNISMKNIHTIKETLKNEARANQSRYFGFQGRSKQRKITILPCANVINEVLRPVAYNKRLNSPTFRKMKLHFERVRSYEQEKKVFEEKVNLEVAKMKKRRAQMPQVDKSQVKSRVFLKKQSARQYINNTATKTFQDLKLELLEELENGLPTDQPTSPKQKVFPDDNERPQNFYNLERLGKELASDRDIQLSSRIVRDQSEILLQLKANHALNIQQGRIKARKKVTLPIKLE